MTISIVIEIVFVVIMIFFLLLSSNLHAPDKYVRKKPPSYYTEKLIVDLAECYLISSSTAIEPYVPDISMPASSLLDPGLYDQNTQKSRFNTTIVFETNGNKYYSNGINKDKITVEYYMMTKKKTTIYYDKNNPENYFFDLSFIEE